MRKVAAFPAFLLGALALAGSVAPACAQVYKWVDDRGVTHYSDEAPAKGRSAKTAVIVRERLSVYSTPSPPATPASQYTGDPILRNRVEALERQILAERLARDSIAAAEARASLAVYERCLADRRVDCDEYGGLYPPYAWPVVVSRPHHHRRPFLAPHSPPLTGMTAGTVVGPGIIPGNFNGPGAVTAGNLVTFRTNLTTQGSRSGRSMFR
ncbi:MAG TPA: DUF4124 domain-containing protein [Burkholderiales bacterium]|nr:DUF4124 domain-containing protein [Burkholderiales bacterium]